MIFQLETCKKITIIFVVRIFFTYSNTNTEDNLPGTVCLGKVPVPVFPQDVLEPILKFAWIWKIREGRDLVRPLFMSGNGYQSDTFFVSVTRAGRNRWF